MVVHLVIFGSLWAMVESDCGDEEREDKYVECEVQIGDDMSENEWRRGLDIWEKREDDEKSICRRKTCGSSRGGVPLPGPTRRLRY